MNPPWRREGDALLLSVRLSPRAARDRIGGRWLDASGMPWLAAWVTAPPDKGRANAALIAMLAKQLGVARTKISLESGDTARLKRLRIAEGDDALIRKLETLTEQA